MTGFVDLSFPLSGRSVGVDAADRLQQLLSTALGLGKEDTLFGIHPLNGLTAEDESEQRLLLSRRTRLILRLPAELVAAAQALAGSAFDLGAGAVRLGEGQIRPLQAAPVIYSAFVHLGPADEHSFLCLAEQTLAACDIRVRLLPGKARQRSVLGEVLSGYSLMLHGLDEEQSLHVQRVGLGNHRRWGCGLFVPHKSIAAVGV